jgi:hypothetical protein
LFCEDAVLLFIFKLKQSKQYPFYLNIRRKMLQLADREALPYLRISPPHLSLTNHDKREGKSRSNTRTLLPGTHHLTF